MSHTVCAALVAIGLIAGAASGELVTSAEQPASALSGRWEGSVDVSGVKLPCAVVFGGAASGPTATIDIQGAKDLPLTAVSVAGNTVHFELPSPIGLATFEGKFDGTTITGTFVQGVTRGTFALARPAPPPANIPPPYREEEVRFSNGDVTLAGTLTIPQGQGPFPAFVMVTGSGLQNRDEELFGFKTFRVIADYFTRHGIAVLRYDDRGIGGSSGSLAPATTADFADDALAGLALLSKRPEIDRAHLGIFGHSEGADVAAIAATRSRSVSFIVMMAGTALRGDVLMRKQAADSARALGATDEQIEAILAAHQQLMEAIRAGAGRETLAPILHTLMRAQLEGRAAAVRPSSAEIDAFIEKAMPGQLVQNQSAWIRFFVGFDPAPVLAQVKCPVLALFGGKDTQVRPDLNRPALESAFARGGNAHVSVKIYPDANHLFLKALTGQVTEYATLPKEFVPGFLDDMLAWVRSVTK